MTQPLWDERGARAGNAPASEEPRLAAKPSCSGAFQGLALGMGEFSGVQEAQEPRLKVTRSHS